MYNKKNVFNDILTTSENNNDNSLHSFEEISVWLKNIKAKVNIQKISLKDCQPWFYDENEGCIRNKSGFFFRIFGIQKYLKDTLISEQPIIIQPEIGYLGIITKKFNGSWHYLMQAKIEPGNGNYVQLAPTLQATKSNFTLKHGGKCPEFLEDFMNVKKEDIIVDQIQSELSSKFYKKRNRNIIIKTEKDIPETENFKWLTLKQIKSLMHYDNMVNMDTRSVISCIPYGNKNSFNISDRETLTELYNCINNRKMFDDYNTKIVKLSDLSSWIMKDSDFVCKDEASFRIIFCDVEIDNREVSKWRQPLIESLYNSVYGLLCCNDNGITKFLVKIRDEIGSFDTAEIGPTVQGANLSKLTDDSVEMFFANQLNNKDNVIIDTMLSDEGGRFYHDINRNVILYADKDEVGKLPPNYVWCDYETLNNLTQINNCLNIQLRNLLALIDL